MLVFCHQERAVARSFLVLLTSLPLCPLSALADVEIPSGGVVELSSGGLDAACTDLVVAGMLRTNSAPVFNVRNVVIRSGGVIDGGASTLTISGNWSNAGLFIATASRVALTDGCGVSYAAVSGNTTFNNLSITSSTGKTWQFAPGSSQWIRGTYTVHGVSGSPLTLTNGGVATPAYIYPQGSASVVDATLIGIATPPTPPMPVPTLGEWGRALLTLVLLAVALWAVPRSRRRQRGA